MGFLVCGVLAGGACADTPALIELQAETNAVCRVLYIGAGAMARSGDALVAMEPPEASNRIAAARAVHAEAERDFQSTRTNRLAFLHLAEQGKASSNDVEIAERDYHRAMDAREEALRDLNRVHREFRTRVLYAPVAGRIVALSVTTGTLVQAGEIVVTLDPSRRE